MGKKKHNSGTKRYVDLQSRGGQVNVKSVGQECLTRMEVISLQAVGVPERKCLGEAVEAAFLAGATMLGFPVLKPRGDGRPYDFSVDGGRRIWKVQVKCATSHRGTRCDARAAGSGELYTLDDIDFLAAYVIKEDLWYVVPADAFVPRATVHFNYGPRSQGMFEKYRETWCLMACSDGARGKGDIPKRCRSEEMPVRCVVCPKRRGVRG
jgi:PD-(D/E)XK endonuclease